MAQDINKIIEETIKKVQAEHMMRFRNEKMAQREILSSKTEKSMGMIILGFITGVFTVLLLQGLFL